MSDKKKYKYKKVVINFNTNDEDKMILEFIQEKSKVIGLTSYMKQLIYEQILREEWGGYKKIGDTKDVTR